jgi:hypothetical protein
MTRFDPWRAYWHPPVRRAIHNIGRGLMIVGLAWGLLGIAADLGVSALQSRDLRDVLGLVLGLAIACVLAAKTPPPTSVATGAAGLFTIAALLGAATFLILLAMLAS